MIFSLFCGTVTLRVGKKSYSILVFHLFYCFLRKITQTRNRSAKWWFEKAAWSIRSGASSVGVGAQREIGEKRRRAAKAASRTWRAQETHVGWSSSSSRLDRHQGTFYKHRRKLNWSSFWSVVIFCFSESSYRRWKPNSSSNKGSITAAHLKTRPALIIINILPRKQHEPTKIAHYLQKLREQYHRDNFLALLFYSVFLVLSSNVLKSPQKRLRKSSSVQVNITMHSGCSSPQYPLYNVIKIR